MEIFKNLPRRTAADNVLRDKAFNIAKNPNDDGHQCGLALQSDQYFDKKYSGSGFESGIMLNQVLPEKLDKPIIRKFKK